MSGSIRDTQARITREALSGRLPILSTERIYSNYTSFLWTCTTFSAATWAFLIGGYLPYLGDTRISILGYLCGMILGMVPVTLASGFPSYRYGVDTIDAAKASFGIRGMILPLIGLLATMVGWTYVLVALTARGAANIIQTVQASADPTPEPIVIGFALLTLMLVWLLASKGPWLFEQLSNYIAPGHIVVTIVMLILLLLKFGPQTLMSANVATDKLYTADQVQGFAYAVEFGISNSLTWWPVMGGLTRLVKSRRDIVGPSVLGVGVLGAAFISSVAAFAAVTAGTPDPTIWMIQLGGRIIGIAIMTFVLAANIATMVIMIYLAGVSIQQVRFLTRVRWDLLIVLLLIPGIYFAFRTEWLLGTVMAWLTYNGVMFVGISGITFVDYFILRKQRVNAAHLFTSSSSGKYYFWGGFNWIAIVVAVVGIALYLEMYNPVSLVTNDYFRYLGAGLPTMTLSAILYFLLIRAVAVPLGKGDYAWAEKSATTSQVPSSSVPVGL
jgi:nucleobase:cation symporter-1, NCS1 family